MPSMGNNKTTGEALQSHMHARKGRIPMPDGDIYRVTHRSGLTIDVRAVSIFDARRYAASWRRWRQQDMHVRVVEVFQGGPAQRTNRLMMWLESALPFNLWR